MNKTFSFWITAGTCTIIVLFELLVSQKWHNHQVLTWDIFGYYLYLPALFYDDIAHLYNLEEIIRVYRPSENTIPAFITENGNYILKYSSGMAFLYAPFFAIAHLWAKYGGYPVDGLSFPYQFMIAWGCTLYSLSGLWIIRKLLIRYFEDMAVGLSVLVIGLATNYLNYASFDSPMQHGPLFLIYSLILLITDNWYRKPAFANSIILGLLCGLVTMTRPSEILCLLIPLFWGIPSLGFVAIKDRLRLLFIENQQYILVFTACFILAGLPQIVYWQLIGGKPFIYSYQGDYFEFDGRHLWKCLFSFRKGWLIYTPVMIFAILGFVPLYKKHRNFFPGMIVHFVLYTYIVFSWHNWWYGGGFGQRTMIQMYPLLMFPLTALISGIFHSSWKWVVFPAMVFCLWLNMFQTWQAQNGCFETTNMNFSFYARIFGKTKIQRSDRRLIDNTDAVPSGKIPGLKTLYFDDFEQTADTVQKPVFSGKKSLEVSALKKIHTFRVIPPQKMFSGWVRAKTQWLCTGGEDDLSGSHTFKLELKNKEKRLRYQELRIHRFATCGKWEEVWVDVKVPALTDTILVEITAGSGAHYSFIDNLSIEYTD